MCDIPIYPSWSQLYMDYQHWDAPPNYLNLPFPAFSVESLLGDWTILRGNRANLSCHMVHHVMCWIAADHIKFRPTTSTRSGKPQLTHPSRRAYLWLRHVEGTFPMKLKPNEFISDMYDMMACWLRIILATIKCRPCLFKNITCFFASWSLFDHCKSDVWCCQNGKDKDPYK